MVISRAPKNHAFVFVLFLSGVLLVAAQVGNSIFGAPDPVVITAPLDGTSTSSRMPPEDDEREPSTSRPGTPSAPPRDVRIDVPFATQAPTGDWNDPYQEACEEASLLLVHHYLSGTPLSNGVMEREILSLVQAEAEQFGFGHDVTIDELATVAREHFGYRTEVIRDFTIGDMKQILAQGYPIIVPLAGRRLGNPYYSGEGPWYHMLVITGFTGTQFITNDVGTKRGAGYRYDFHRLYDNIHDWTGVKEDIEKGQKVMLIVKK